MSGAFRLELPEWMDQAACRYHPNPDAFFAERGGAAAAARARSFCGMCPVAGECLRFALEEKIVYGIWGGLAPKQRRRLVVTSDV